MPRLTDRFASGVRIHAEDRIAGGLFFFVLTRSVLVLAEDGTATLEDELVVDSWFEPSGFERSQPSRRWRGTWSSPDGVTCTVELHDVEGGLATAYAHLAGDDCLVVAAWEGERTPAERVFERARS